MSRRSQMEILGLAIVFVLIITGFLLYLKFSDGSERTTKEEYLLPAKAQSILTSMLRMHVRCFESHESDSPFVSYSVSDLLKDGADVTLQDIQCYNSDYNYIMDSETYAEYYMNLSLSLTMEVWGEDYWYKAVRKDNPTPPIASGNSTSSCSEDSRQRDSGFHAIELRTDTLEITFGICT